MKIRMFVWLTAVLEKLGWRCSKCKAWWKPVITIEDKLEWGTNIGDVLFTDPFYMKTTSCRCAQCGHLMFEKHKLSDKKVEVGK